PSGVHVFAITLERPAVEVDLQPDAFAHVWTAPATPSYTVTLRNTSTAQQAVALDMDTQAFNNPQTGTVREQVQLTAGETRKIKLSLKDVKRYGHHAVRLQVRTGAGGNPEALRSDPKVETRLWNRSLAYLHPDTRERGNWEEDKGPIFGFWDW